MKIKSFCFVDRSARILYNENGFHAAGFVKNQIEPLPDDKLSTPIARTEPHKPDSDWTLWFRIFENALVSKPVFIDQWAVLTHGILLKIFDRTCLVT